MAIPSCMFRTTAVAALIAMTTTACSGVPRPERSVQQLQLEKQTVKANQDATVDATIDKVVARMEMIQDDQTGDTTYDVLMLSGGGDWGVFGAAFLVGWLENEDLPLPDFDYISGISTGSLIAAYTASGRRDRYLNMEQFYLETDEEFVQIGSILSLGTRFLRNDPALVDTSRVEDAIEGAIDDQLIEELRSAAIENKVVAAGAVNLDLGLFQAFDLTEELTTAEDPKERLQRILLASSAVPAAFPPVEIDGNLYADGGASLGIPIFRLDQLPRVLERWSRRNPGPAPKIRFWVLFNNKLGVQPVVTDISWSDVLLRSYKIALQTTLVAPLYALDRVVEVTEGEQKVEVEVRWTAIPEDYEEVAADKAFVPEAMRELSGLGRAMGRDPNSWQTEVPQF